MNFDIVGKTYKSKDNGELVGVLNVKKVNNNLSPEGSLSLSYFRFTDFMFIRRFEDMDTDLFFTLYEETTPTTSVTVRNENGVPLIYGKQYMYKKGRLKEKATFLRMLEMGLGEFILDRGIKSLPTSTIYELV